MSDLVVLEVSRADVFYGNLSIVLYGLLFFGFFGYVIYSIWLAHHNLVVQTENLNVLLQVIKSR